MIRIGSALFNADHGRLLEEMREVEAAGIDFVHFDVFDGSLVPDLGFPPRTVETLREHTDLPFEVHLVSKRPLQYLDGLKAAGADLVFLPAEACPMLYEAIFEVKETGMKTGLCLALGTPLAVLEPVLPLLDSVLLLARVTGEGSRGRRFHPFGLEKVRCVRQWIDEKKLNTELQAAGGLEADSCLDAVKAGTRSLPLGGFLHRQKELKPFLAELRHTLESTVEKGSFAL